MNLHQFKRNLFVHIQQYSFCEVYKSNYSSLYAFYKQSWQILQIRASSPRISLLFASRICVSP